MTALVGPVLVIAGFGLYLLATVVLARFRRMPWEFLALSTAGALLSAVVAVRTPSPSMLAAAAVSAGLLAGLYWFFFAFSMYGPREDRPRVGDLFPPFQLPASDGSLYAWASTATKRRLLIFYRGSW